MSETIEAWWFAAGDTLPHGDGRKIVLGETHKLRGKLVICKNALHASRNPFDALQYAPGPYLYKVRCGGTIVEQDDKLGCSERTYVAMHDATDMLREFARGEALRVLHLWDAPEVVRRYLETGDETIRDTARDAALAAARDTALAAALAAAWDAALAAAWDAARCAALDAARCAARCAARDAARDAAWEAARQRFNDAVKALFNG